MASLVLSASARADDRAAARDHLRRGTRAYNLGHYREAVQEFEAAYQIKDDPALLFDIGQAYRAAGDYANAITAYKSFLRNLPKSERRHDIVERIHELETVLAAQTKAQTGPPEGTLSSAHAAEPPPAAEEAPAPAPAVLAPPVTTPTASAASPEAAPAAAAPADAHRGRIELYAGIGVAVVGVAAIATGGAMGALAKQAADEFVHPKSGVYSESADRGRIVDQQAEVALLAVGGAALVGGVITAALGAREMKRARLSASIGPGRVAATVEIRF